jgi:hypothetical protein
MTVFEKVFKNASIDSIAEFLDENGMYDHTPWMDWWNENYCDKCETLEIPFEDSKELLGFEPVFGEGTMECAYCEVHHLCRFFPDGPEDGPAPKEIIKMWLESEAN